MSKVRGILIRWPAGDGWVTWCEPLRLRLLAPTDLHVARKRGRQPLGLENDAAGLFLQKWVNLSDPRPKRGSTDSEFYQGQLGPSQLFARASSSAARMTSTP